MTASVGCLVLVVGFMAAAGQWLANSFDVADDALITHERRRAVVGHFENDLNLFSRFVGNDEAGFAQRIAVGDGHGVGGGIGIGVLPPFVRELVAVGIGGGGFESHGVAGLRSEEHTSELQSLRHLVC